jgi:trans-2,3-dihydro-3-hydroxyanthranilate isomerase
MRRRFATLDVFTDRRFAGNPLAVVLDADALDMAAMQAIAREFNHPETVFVFAPADPAHRARVRIFTPARELPFAGHPTVGTAVLLGARDGGGRDLVLEEGIGPVQCTIESSAGGGSAASRSRNCRRRPARQRTTAPSRRRSRSPQATSARAVRRDGRPAFPSPSCRSSPWPR